ncbi:MAG: ATP-binding protein [Deltaproteobacteria bacterium]|nr:ATP-binding protein [Deltaproteobacteria bacterium]
MCTTNKPFASWGTVLHDEDLAQAILDRVSSTPWLNQVEGGLGSGSLETSTGFGSKAALKADLAAYLKDWKRSGHRSSAKLAKAIIKSHRKMLDRISTAPEASTCRRSVAAAPGSVDPWWVR